MSIFKQIEKEQQLIEYYKRAVALEKNKHRKAETRNKIELGGLVIKSGMNIYNKSIILGSLIHSRQRLEKNQNFLDILKIIGNELFIKVE